MPPRAEISPGLQLLLSSSAWKAEPEQSPRLATWSNRIALMNRFLIARQTVFTESSLGSPTKQEPGRLWVRWVNTNWKTFSKVFQGWWSILQITEKQPMVPWSELPVVRERDLPEKSWGEAVQIRKEAEGPLDLEGEQDWNNSSNWAERGIIANHIRSSSLIICSWMEASVEVLDKQIFRAVPTFNNCLGVIIYVRVPKNLTCRIRK